MAQKEAPGIPTDEETLQQAFKQGMAMYDEVENSKEPTNSDAVQMTIRNAIIKFEQATNMVSLSGMFSRNEKVEELPTETLQYLLLPALLGTLTLKICGRQRADVIRVAEIYFRDFLQRCKDYEVSEFEIPPPSNPDADTECAVQRPQSEQAKIAHMVLSREAKIKRYKEAKALKERLETLSKTMASPNIDEETKRDYFLTLLYNYINQALDELSSIEVERPMLEYMAKHATEHKPKEREVTNPLKPVIITRDEIQKAVFGAGYPSLPTVTIEEFYDRRVREGLFPGSCSSVPQTTGHTSVGDPEETEKERKERLAETDDPEERARQQKMDEYKDDHRTGWGNRHNRS